MAIKKFNPITHTLRYKTVRDTSHLDKGSVPNYLIKGINYKAGRSGSISSWQRGGRHKRRYRVIDFKRDKNGVPGVIVSMHYDPNRSADLALIKYRDGEYRFILAPDGVEIGQIILSDVNGTNKTRQLFGFREYTSRFSCTCY